MISAEQQHTLTFRITISPAYSTIKHQWWAMDPSLVDEATYHEIIQMLDSDLLGRLDALPPEQREIVQQEYIRTIQHYFSSLDKSLETSSIAQTSSEANRLLTLLSS